MRIVHVIETLDPAQGGPPVVVANLAMAQRSLGHEILVATQSATKVDSVPMLRLPSHSAFDLWRRPSTDAIALVKKADILHLHGVWEPLLPTIAKSACVIGRPYVVAPHGMLDPWSLSQGRWKKKLALAFGYRHLLDRASALHVLNEDEKRLIEPLKLRALCEVIPNGIFLEQLDPPPDASLFRSRKDGPGSRPYILFLGRLHYKKGLDLLADAFAAIANKHPQIDLVVAGPDDGELPPFRDRIAAIGLSQRVWITGPIYGADKWSAIAGASVFCLPSRQEGFSIAILEALACRVPVVVTENCHFPELAEVAAGRVVSLNVPAIANALDQVLADPNAKSSMGSAGRKLVEHRFTWPKVAARTVDFYERLLKTAPAR